MKHLLQNLKNGQSQLITCPMPVLEDKSLLIATRLSLISTGTERSLVDFGKASYIGKAKQQPDKVNMLFQKIKTQGLLSTIEAVRSKLSQPIPLGYCNVGEVLAVGKDVCEFKPGDRVVSNGNHAEIVQVSEHLCAPIPDTVSDETAVFTILSSIALQGIRLANPTLGEKFAVVGVGIIGLLTVQLLRANGCQVLAIDLDDDKLALASQYGAEICNPNHGDDPVLAGIAFSQGYGIDGVLITAATQSNLPIQQAAQMSRKRGRIILVGVAGLQINRADFYEKELSFQVSCSYGPGRYDKVYEKETIDYPIGYVRWTEQRNFQAILQTMQAGQLTVESLISARFAFEDAPSAYDHLTKHKNCLGILLTYASTPEDRCRDSIELKASFEAFHADKPIIGMIGAGNYSSRMLIPAFQKLKAQLHTLISKGGANSSIHGKRMGFLQASSNVDNVFQSDVINTVVIATRHDSHASLTLQALESHQHVFVEKPLALDETELNQIQSVYQQTKQIGSKALLMIGFNRRFAPHVQKMRQLLNPMKSPKSIIITVNAGSIPEDHWTQDKNIGGGRIIGEACHFVDLARFLVGSPIISVDARKFGENAYETVTEDKASIILGFLDGSFASIHYLANGSQDFPKERVEVFVGGKILALDNFLRLKAYGFSRFKKMNLWKQDKGHIACLEAFLNAIETGKPSPIPEAEIFEVSGVVLEITKQLRQQDSRGASIILEENYQEEQVS